MGMYILYLKSLFKNSSFTSLNRYIIQTCNITCTLMLQSNSMLVFALSKA